MSAQHPDKAADPMQRGLAFDRMVFFSDAVFAIAITLLVIELHLPSLSDDPTTDEVVAAMLAVLPGVLAYGLSFATIGLYWLAHWRRYREVERVDERLVGLNLVLLAFVAFIPFPTAILGEHLNEPAVVVVYAVSLSLAGLIGTLNWVYLWRSGLVRPGLSRRFVRYSTLRGLSVPLVMMTSLAALPLIGPTWTEVCWILIFPVQVVLDRALRAPEDEDSRLSR